MKRLTALDHQYLWHPFTQMQDWMAEEPVIIVSGRGAVLRDDRGREYLDANSSIWTNLHGHRHPLLDAALRAQLGKIAHSSFLGLSNPPAIKLAEQLVKLAPRGLTRVFYSDDGSTAMEVAIKMALQYWQHCNRSHRRRFVTFSEAYHGDTLGAVSVGGIALFQETYQPLLFDVARAENLESLRRILARHGREIAAVCIEPLIQGAAGMRLWPRGLLREVRALCNRYDTLLIVDEVFTGFGRTGTMFACEQEEVMPDLMAIAKGLTGGYLPLAATLTTEEIFEAFLGDYTEKKTFFHGHSYTGNALGCAVALANLEVFRREKTLAKLRRKIVRLAELLAGCRSLPHVGEVRQCGFIAAVELTGYEWEERIGIRVCAEMRRRGVLTRPLGNIIPLIPPYCVTDRQLHKMVRVLQDSITRICGK